MEFETPFPVRGTVEVSGDVTSYSLPCEHEWLSEGPTDHLQAAVDRAVREYGEDTEVRVVWSGSHGECTGFNVIGPVDDL